MTTVSKLNKKWIVGLISGFLIIVVGVITILLTSIIHPQAKSIEQKKETLGLVLNGPENQKNLLGSFYKSANYKPTTEDLSNGKCECVTYVVYRIFGKRLGDVAADTAGRMASETYWNQIGAAYQKGYEESGYRYLLLKTDNLQTGDVIIMQPDAVVYPWNNNISWWDSYFKDHPEKGIGYGAGHIGIVEKAEYWSDFGGWYIRFWNANWPESWGTGYETYTFIDRESKIAITCKNVQISEVFIPSGSKVSFWRKK